MAGRASAKTLARAAESAIVSLAQTGDAQAFDEIVRRKHNRVRYFMRYLSGRPNDADDLAQLVFLKAWRSITQLKSATFFDAWLKTIMVRTWLEHARRREILYASELDAAEVAQDRDSTMERMDLEAAVDQLPAPMRLCVVLAYHEGMSHEEIAKLTDMPLGTVKSNVRRGSARLRGILSAYASTAEGDKRGT